MEINNLETGDLLLFTKSSSNGFFFSIMDSLISYFTESEFIHIGMILKDPYFINSELNGLYLWESSWQNEYDPQDQKHKFGVRLTKMETILDVYKDSNIIVRRLSDHEKYFNQNILSEIHQVVYEKPYDIYPIDWIEAIFKKDIEPQKTSRFWCSALVGYIYTKCGILNSNTDWSILRPSDFSLDSENLVLNQECKFCLNDNLKLNG